MSGELHTPAALRPRKSRRYHCARRWVVTRTGLDAVENRYFSPPGIEPSFFGHQAHSLVSIPTTTYIVTVTY